MKKSVLLLLFLSITLSAELFTVQQIRLKQSHSPGVSTFYKKVLSELIFNYYQGVSDSIEPNKSSFCVNSSTTTSLHYLYSFWKKPVQSGSFSPLLTASVTHKRLMYMSEEEGFLFTTHTYRDMRFTSFELGISPEWLLGVHKTAYGYHRAIALQPHFSLNNNITYGTLGDTYFLSSTIGTAAQIEFCRERKSKQLLRGIGLGVSASYNRVLLGKKDVSTTYGQALERTASYPRNAFHIGFFLTYVIRSAS